GFFRELSAGSRPVLVSRARLFRGSCTLCKSGRSEHPAMIPGDPSSGKHNAPSPRHLPGRGTGGCRTARTSVSVRKVVREAARRGFFQPLSTAPARFHVYSRECPNRKEPKPAVHYSPAFRRRVI